MGKLTRWIESSAMVDPDLAPTIATDGNLRFTENGVYAEYLLAGPHYPFQPVRRRQGVARVNRDLALALPSGSLLMGPGPQMDLAETLEAMIDGTDYGRRPEFAEGIAGMYDFLRLHQRPWERLFIVSAPLDSSVGKVGKGVLSAAGLRRGGPDDAEVASYRAREESLFATLPAAMRPRRLSFPHMNWLWEYHLGLGTYGAPFPALAEQVITPGRNGFAAAKVTPYHGTSVGMLKVERLDADAPASYQSPMVVASFPPGGIVFPGSEFLQRVDFVGEDVQIWWVQRLEFASRARAQAANMKAARTIDDQFHQRSMQPTGATNTLARKEQGLAEYDAELDANPGDEEIRFTTVFCVGSRDPRRTEETVLELKHSLEELHVTTHTKKGAEKSVWKTFVPGARANTVIKGYAQTTTTNNWCRFVPVQGSGLGNTSGCLLGLNLSAGRPETWFVDLPGATGRGKPGNVVVLGDQGSGKTYTASRVLDDLAGRGHTWTMLDNGPLQEWVAKAQATPGAKVVDLAKQSFSLDALRIFPTEQAGTMFAEHMFPLLGIRANTVEEALLARVLTPESRDALGIRSTRGLVRYLNSPEADPRLRDVAALLEQWSWDDYCASVFDENAPILDLATATAVAVSTRRVQLPSMREMEGDRLATLTKPKRAGNMLYGMVASFVQESYFADSSRFGILGVEEAGHWTVSEHGQNVAYKFASQARKHWSGLMVISQLRSHVRGISEELILNRIVHRTTDPAAAAEALAFVGIDPQEYPDQVDTLCRDTSPAEELDPRDIVYDEHGEQISSGYVRPDRMGEGYGRDEFGRTGRIRTLPHGRALAHAAAETTPEAARR